MACLDTLLVRSMAAHRRDWEVDFGEPLATFGNHFDFAFFLLLSL